MTQRTGGSRLAGAWRSVLALAFALAGAVAPALALAQGAGASGAGGGAPGGAPAGGAARGSGSGAFFGWIVVILAIAVVIWLFTRRRGGPAPGARR